MGDFRHGKRKWRLFAASLLLASFLMLLPVSLQSVPADASPDANCYNPNCYGFVTWPGATYGAKTDVFVNNLYVPVYNYNFLTEEMWLADENYNPPAWTEIGYYSGYPTSWNDISYFYAMMTPTQSYTEQNLGSVTPPDRGGYSWIKITRNRQTTSTLLDIHS